MFARALGPVVLLLVVVSTSVDAQLMASEPGSVSQTVDGTTISVDYSRPRARGRTGLFGTRIHWGEVWTPGANAATTMSLGKDVTLNGTPVPKGKYSVWMVVSRGDWELVLDRDTTMFHTQGPRARAGQVRFPVKRETRPFMEVLTWWFPEVTSTGATLAMQWDTVYVPLRIGVPASHAKTVSADVARPIVGRYRLHFEPRPQPARGDTTIPPEEQPPDDVSFTIRYEGGELHAVMDPPMYSSESGYSDWMVLPKKGDWFVLGRMNHGELVEIFDFFGMQFQHAGGVATGFELRTTSDNLVAKARRIP